MSQADPAAESHPVLPRVLGAATAYCVVVGSVIGSGIFMVPASVANDVPFLGGIILVWILGGLFSTAGALTLAELGAMMPHAGGAYVYLRAAYGKVPAFLFGWVEFLIGRAGSMATLAAAFARYFDQVAPPPAGVSDEIWQAGAAIVAIIIVTVVNVLGTERGGALQVIGTALKVGGVAALIGLPFVLNQGSTANLSPFWPSVAAGSWFSGIMTAMVGVLWAYDGWISVTPLAEEIREPERNIPRALILGMATLVAVYLGATLAYHYVLPIEEVAAASQGEGGIRKAVSAVYCKRLLGENGVLAISLLVMASTFISLNGNALTGPRAYFALARDGLLPRMFGRINPRFRTPANAVMAQGAWAVILTAVGTALLVTSPPAGAALPGPIRSAWSTLQKTPLYDILFTYVVFGEHVFYLLAIGSVFVLRRTRPDLPRPYRTWGYPWTPLAYVVAEIIFLGNTLLSESTRTPSLASLGIILAGLPAYLLFRRSSMLADQRL
jgi:amino acid transporter